jgi:sulfatase modifying factor 1
MRSVWGLVVVFACGCGGKTSEHAPPPEIDTGSDGGGAVDVGHDADAVVDASPPPPPPSCAVRKAGTDRCGPGDDCCASLRIPGGSFLRAYDAVNFTNRSYPATVSDFWLDEFEITVGRFRAFVDAYPSSKPVPGAGAHPRISNSGWQASWPVAVSKEALANDLATGDCSGSRTWTAASGGNEDKPITCLTWYELYAFCAWDGGRLPTYAEWNYAASGGSAQKAYPWSSPPPSMFIDATKAVYTSDLKTPLPVAAVGSKPAGASTWGPLDMAGNVWESTLDIYNPNLPVPCVDCADLNLVGSTDPRAVHGGGADSVQENLVVSRPLPLDADNRDPSIGARCAR